MNKIILTSHLLIIFLFLSLTFSFSQNDVNLPNIASMYNPTKTTLHPKYKIYHKNNNKSTVFSYFYLSELNFVRLYDDTFEGKLKIKYIFLESLKSKNILDSVSKIVEFQKTNIQQSVTTYFDLKVPVDKCYLVIVTKDLYNNQKSINIIHVDKTQSSKQNFLLVDAKTLKPIFMNNLEQGKSYKIKHNSGNDSLLVSLYKADTMTFNSPFSGLNSTYKPELDSQFYVNSFADFQATKFGIYEFSDLENNASVSYTCFANNFPEVTNPDEMFEPIKYLCTVKEYRDYKSQINKKIVVDDFWLSINNDPNAAKALIKIYYNRLLYANLNFSAAREGWKTDRGMIYMIFGPPKILHKGDEFEEWIYVDAFSGERITFVFDEKTTDFSFISFSLRSNSSESVYWKNAVQSWREGTLYMFH